MISPTTRILAKFVALCCAACASDAHVGADGGMDAGDTQDGSSIEDAQAGDGDGGTESDASHGDDAGSDFMCISACGSGDLSGAWSYQGVCGDGVLATIARDCGSSSTYSVSQNQIEGHLVLDASGAFSHVQRRVYAGQLSVSVACLEPLGGCVMFGDMLRPSGRCTEHGSVCTCSFETTASRTSSGTHDLRGNQLRLTLLDGSEEIYDYCAMTEAAMLQLAVPPSPEAYGLRRQ